METLRINYDYWWKKLTTEFFELTKLKGYTVEKTERLLTFVLHLMQLPKELEAGFVTIQKALITYKNILNN